MDGVRDALRASASVPEGARAAIDGTVDRAAASLSKSAAVAIEALSSRLASVRAHVDLAASRIASAEDAVFSPAVARVAQVTAANPYASASALGACAVIALPGARRLLWRATVGRAASEEAVFNAASRSAETLRVGAESGAKELRRLRDQVQAGEVEMLRGQQKLRQAASRLRALVRLLPRRAPERSFGRSSPISKRARTRRTQVSKCRSAHY